MRSNARHLSEDPSYRSPARAASRCSLCNCEMLAQGGVLARRCARALLLLGVLSLGCARDARPVSGPKDDASEAAAADPSTDEALEPEAEATPDEAEPDAQSESPSWAVSQALSALERPEPPDGAKLGLRFEVVASGPDLPWVSVVKNIGSRPVRLLTDPRLFRFEVQAPNKKKPDRCELPKELFPDEVEKALWVELGPGEGVVQTFDPRLYCFSATSPEGLVPDAVVTPRFGFPPKTKTVWRGGRRLEEPLSNQKAPFVASPAGLVQKEPLDEPREPTLLQKGKPDLKAAASFPGESIKELSGSPFSLGAAFARWSDSEPDAKPEAPLSLTISRGSDARTQLDATLTVALENRSHEGQRLFFRRELLSFVVLGPDGERQCRPLPDDRAPAPEAFLNLRAGKSATFTSRLVELCPGHAFSRPGLYLVHARFDALEDGSQYGYSAFVGTLASTRPAKVRIRKGPLPFSEGRPPVPIDLDALASKE